MQHVATAITPEFIEEGLGNTDEDTQFNRIFKVILWRIIKSELYRERYTLEEETQKKQNQTLKKRLDKSTLFFRAQPTALIQVEAVTTYMKLSWRKLL